MKKPKMLIPMLVILMLASAITPVLAAKGKPEKIEYTLSGYIFGIDQGGEAKLSISGNAPFQRAPDYEYEGFGGYWTWSLRSSIVGEDIWENETGKWMKITYLEREEAREVSYDYHAAVWYSPQPTYKGKLDAAWWDGSATTFTVQLDPYMIQKETRVGKMTVEVAETNVYEFYIWVEFEWNGYMFGYWEFQWMERDEPITLGPFTYDFVETVLYFDFSGKIQSKGRPPLQETLSLWDTFTVLDGVSEERSISGRGTFGPYYLSIYT